MLYIALFYKENKNVIEDDVIGEIISKRELQPKMCDNCHSFYYNFTTYRCVCGVVYRRYCDACL